MHIGLWIVQVLLAAAFLMAGSMKIVTPIAELGSQMAWVGLFPDAVIRLIGLAEVTGALGLLLPSFFRIKPGLTPLAAVALALTMVGAVVTHMYLQEWGAMMTPLLLGALSVFVAWGRHRRAPIEARMGVSLREQPHSA